ncbi:hypothetical protein [Streptomyces scabiei]|uniref:hypothetical protein n=1 Tax=Streptomyces scabiei TaxID=1930 RepID=UPI0029B04839|nr:hypothetical protein [Streptomyces scabiei]MDX3209923.1 hypothetical protein [Streptomyces scabiei]
MPGTPDQPDFSGLGESEGQQVADIVQEVVHWYTEQIAAERRAPLPDEERIAQLTAGRTTAYQDLARLEEADAQEEDRLAALYAARLRQLEP